MVLLSQAMRTAAITGSTDSFFSRVVGRQGGRWAEQHVAAAMPARTGGPRMPRTAVLPPAPADPARTLAALRELHAAGVVTQAEFEQLRSRLQAPNG